MLSTGQSDTGLTKSQYKYIPQRNAVTVNTKDDSNISRDGQKCFCIFLFFSATLEFKDATRNEANIKNTAAASN